MWLHDLLKHPIDKLRTTQILPPIQLRIQDGGRAHQDGVDHDEAEEEEEGLSHPNPAPPYNGT
uniref:Uncharacterized protein n=1 Tax=Oryza glumipatula TaxID=40148 RepID=A0A0D9YUJ5_9ORYZ